MIIKAYNVNDITPIELSYSSIGSKDGVSVDLNFYDFGSLKDVVKEVGDSALLDEMSDDDIASYLRDGEYDFGISLDDVTNKFSSSEILSFLIKQYGEEELLNYISEDTLKTHMREIIIDELDD